MANSPDSSPSTGISIVSSNVNTPSEAKYVVDDNLDVSQDHGNVEEDNGSLSVNMVNNLSYNNQYLRQVYKNYYVIVLIIREIFQWNNF